MRRAETERIKKVVSKAISPWYERNSLWGVFAWPVSGLLFWLICRQVESRLFRWLAFILLCSLSGFGLLSIRDMPSQRAKAEEPLPARNPVEHNNPQSASVPDTANNEASKGLPSSRTHTKTTASREGLPTFLGVHRPDEALVVPPNSSAIISPKPLSKKDRADIEGKDRQDEVARQHLKTSPDQLVLHDLFLTDSSASPQTTSTSFSGFTLRNAATGTTTHIEYGVVRQLEVGVKYVLFYVPPTNETPNLCLALAEKYKFPLDDFMEKLIVTQKTPGDSEQTSSENLAFANRVFIYNETNISPEQIIQVRDAFKKQGVIVILRSTDYLSNKKLEAKVKLLEKTTAR
jgi:hypothetical protein